MSNTSVGELEIGAADVAEALSTYFDGASCTVGPIEVEPLRYGIMNPVTQGLHRVTGTATVDGEIRPWSMIRKAMGLDPASGPNPSFEMSDEPRHWNYWKRELLAYTSGYLPNEPGALRAPRCFAAHDLEGDRAVLWLEELTGRSAETWPSTRCAVAARQLGRWQAGLTGANLPDEPWLSRDWLRVLLTTRLRREAEIVADPANWKTPLVRELFDPSLRERVGRIWDASGELLDGLDRLPQTLSHYDFRAPNLFDGDSADEVRLLDWQFVGEGALGQDLVGIVIDAVFMSDFPPHVLDGLESAALQQYVAGLRAGRWRGDPLDVRTAYAATAGIRFGLAAGWLLQLANRPDEAAVQEERYGQPINELLKGRLVAVDRALELGEQALERFRTMEFGVRRDVGLAD
jgi:hypothetical protein